MKHSIFRLNMPFVPLFILTRPWNCLSALLAVLVGARVGGSSMVTVPLLLAALTTAAITGGGNAINDYFDQAIDGINKPRRPLPSGHVRPHQAILLALALFSFGIGLSLALGVELAMIAASLAILSFLYSWKIKSFFLSGNVLVAFLSSMTVVYGALISGNVGMTLPSMALIFIFILGREILKTAEDYAGDAAHRMRTVAVLFGQTTTARLFVAATLLILSLLLWPGLTGKFSFLYFLLIYSIVVPVLVIAAVCLCFWPHQRQIALVLRATKVIFFVWLIAMLSR